jgi:sec-independent protein translocase protein TatA
MFGVGLPELGIILVIALVVFGPGKLPEIGKAIGTSIGEFKKATTEIKNDITVAVQEKQEEPAKHK